mgnify:CR=1 FL=1
MVWLKMAGDPVMSWVFILVSCMPSVRLKTYTNASWLPITTVSESATMAGDEYTLSPDKTRGESQKNIAGQQQWWNPPVAYCQRNWPVLPLTAYTMPEADPTITEPSGAIAGDDGKRSCSTPPFRLNDQLNICVLRKRERERGGGEGGRERNKKKKKEINR